MVCKHCGKEIEPYPSEPRQYLTHRHIHSGKYRCDGELSYMRTVITNVERGVKYATPLETSDYFKALKKCIG